mmetsp:Transcript_147067/g.472290  ORF Transcript_147067/g.472290 Transcript_147067/m.472290 type:complete len:949 (-) Transcript_147067:161-3007(-)
MLQQPPLAHRDHPPRRQLMKPRPLPPPPPPAPATDWQQQRGQPRKRREEEEEEREEAKDEEEEDDVPDWRRRAGRRSREGVAVGDPDDPDVDRDRDVDASAAKSRAGWRPEEGGADEDVDVDVAAGAVEPQGVWDGSRNTSSSGAWPDIVVASQAGAVEAVRSLLEARSDPNELNTAGEGALWHAVAGHEEAMVKMLLEARADPKQSATSPEGQARNILDLAIDSGAPKSICRALMAARKQVASAQRFLSSAIAQTLSREDKEAFLARKELNPEEIAEAFRRHERKQAALVGGGKDDDALAAMALPVDTYQAADEETKEALSIPEAPSMPELGLVAGEESLPEPLLGEAAADSDESEPPNDGYTQRGSPPSPERSDGYPAEGLPPSPPSIEFAGEDTGEPGYPMSDLVEDDLPSFGNGLQPDMSGLALPEVGPSVGVRDPLAPHDELLYLTLEEEKDRASLQALLNQAKGLSSWKGGDEEVEGGATGADISDQVTIASSSEGGSPPPRPEPSSSLLQPPPLRLEEPWQQPPRQEEPPPWHEEQWQPPPLHEEDLRMWSSASKAPPMSHPSAHPPSSLWPHPSAQPTPPAQQQQQLPQPQQHLLQPLPQPPPQQPPPLQPPPLQPQAQPEQLLPQLQQQAWQSKAQALPPVAGPCLQQVIRPPSIPPPPPPPPPRQAQPHPQAQVQTQSPPQQRLLPQQVLPQLQQPQPQQLQQLQFQQSQLEPQPQYQPWQPQRELMQELSPAQLPQTQLHPQLLPQSQLHPQSQPLPQWHFKARLQPQPQLQQQLQPPSTPNRKGQFQVQELSQTRPQSKDVKLPACSKGGGGGNGGFEGAGAGAQVAEAPPLATLLRAPPPRHPHRSISAASMAGIAGGGAGAVKNTALAIKGAMCRTISMPDVNAGAAAEASCGGGGSRHSPSRRGLGRRSNGCGDMMAGRQQRLRSLNQIQGFA